MTFLCNVSTDRSFGPKMLGSTFQKTQLPAVELQQQVSALYFAHY
jgi:hypothetical protein